MFWIFTISLTLLLLALGAAHFYNDKGIEKEEEEESESDLSE